MRSRLSILGNAKEENRHSARRESECGPYRSAFDGSTRAKIIHVRGEKIAEPSGFHSWETRGQQGRERARKKIDGRRTVRYCPQSRFGAVGRQDMSLEQVTPSGRIVED